MHFSTSGLMVSSIALYSSGLPVLHSWKGWFRCGKHLILGDVHTPLQEGDPGEHVGGEVELAMSPLDPPTPRSSTRSTAMPARVR